MPTVDLPLHGRDRARRTGGFVLAAVLLLVAVAAGLAVGARPLPLADVAAALVRYDPALDAHVVVHTVRVPRTVVGVLVGAAMGGAGALMQGLTRNPLADPGILGVNAGASLFLVVAVAWLGIGSLAGQVWFGFLGAAVASVAVHVLGHRGRGGGTPIALTLAGAAVAILVSSVVGLVLLTDRATNTALRYWAVGSLAGRDLAVVAGVAPFVLAGLVLALACGRALNAVGLGEDVARGLGVRVGRARALTALAVVLLCGAGTAAAGPVSFVGFLVPHVARAVTGPDHRWILPYSMVLGALLLVVADVVGRVVVAPAEFSAGLVVAVVGGPVFVLLARRRTLAEL